MSKKTYWCKACERIVDRPWFVCPHCAAFKEIEEKPAPQAEKRGTDD